MSRIPPLALVLLIAACGAMPSLRPYRIEIQQGNYVTQQMLAQLKPGLTRDQVRYVLGTPLINDVFHQDRWDYVFVREPANSSDFEYSRISVFFKDDKLVGVDGMVDASVASLFPPGNEVSSKDAR